MSLDQIVDGTHTDPFSVLGPHRQGRSTIVRSFQPQARRVELIDPENGVLCEMQRVLPDGLFEAALPKLPKRYRLKIFDSAGATSMIEDPYRFSFPIGEIDLYLFGQGEHQSLYEVLGARVCELDGVSGTHFAVWAPNARRVSVVGDFNQWDGRRHPMRLYPGIGVWSLFIPAVDDGSLYKFELLDGQGALLPLKSDPLAYYFEAPPGNASRVYSSRFEWSDEAWMAERKRKLTLDQPVSIYEVHFGSWRRTESGEWLGYRELADQLVAYVLENGFTHIELLPVTEHPFDGSWGYQPIGMFAPTQRFGEPDDFRYFVNACHVAGIGVIMDWVPAHFPRDEHGLARFDGTPLYEHPDPRRAEHVNWGTLMFDYGRNEVRNYLIASALFWVNSFHIDALRVDAVASMLYLDYSRGPGEWVPNKYGGKENLEAVAFLRQLNDLLANQGAVTFAEESTSWLGVTAKIYDGGLGFTYKWNMGWMNDTLAYVCEDPINRKYHHHRLTFGLTYAFHENFLLPLSHDEVVYGKRSLLGRMPGSDAQRFANLRNYFAFMFAYPGKKLLFMGDEFGQQLEWNHDRSLDWPLLDVPAHSGVQQLVRSLNQVYRNTSALHELDNDERGFEWIDCQDRDASVFAWLRWSKGDEHLVCVSNFTPVIRYNYRIGVPGKGQYRELINTDDKKYAGGGAANPPLILTDAEGCHNRSASLSLTLPPLATLFLAPVHSHRAHPGEIDDTP